MAWIPVRPAIATRKGLAARANPMATNRLARAAQVALGPVAHAQAVRVRGAHVPMATVAQVAAPVIADRVAKVATAQAMAKVVRHAPHVRMDIRATRQTSRPTTPIRVASTPMANARVAIAPRVIVRARDHAPVVRAARIPAVLVDRNPVAHAAAIAEESSK